MFETEPNATSALLLGVGILLLLSVVFSRASRRVGVPIFLLFLVLGMLAGSEGIGGIYFEDYGLSFRLGSAALALILFDGGLNTRLRTLKPVLAPAAVLATVAVAGTAGVMALAARGLGFAWPAALLLGAVVSSTDAAAVFSVLRASGVQLKQRVATTLELESGLNDPLAVLLTTLLTALMSGQGGSWQGTIVAVPLQLAIGAAVGLGVGWAARRALQGLRLPAGGLYAVFTLGIAFLAFGGATLLYGSGFLAVYVTGVVLGNGEFPYRSGLLRFHDAVAWLAQVVMFLLLGLLVFPSRLIDSAFAGLGLALLLACVARPLVVWLCLLPFRYTHRERLYIGWVGLRGAVPIILATVPVLAGATGAERIFDLVFFVVVTTAFIPGTTVGWVTRRSGLLSTDPPPPTAVLEITSLQPLEGDILSFTVSPCTAACGAEVRQFPFPESVNILLVVRGQELVTPRGGTLIQAGDHVYVFTKPEDRPFVELIFGRPEET